MTESRSKIAPIVVLAAVMIAAIVAGGTALNRARQTAHRSQCLSNLKNVATALIMYRVDNLGYMPPADRPDDPYYWVPYLLGDEKAGRPRYFGMPTGALFCRANPPSDRKETWGPTADRLAKISRAPERWTRYHGETLLAGRHESCAPHAASVLVAWEDEAYHLGGRCVGRFSGGAKWLENSDFEVALIESRKLILPDEP